MRLLELWNKLVAAWTASEWATVLASELTSTLAETATFVRSALKTTVKTDPFTPSTMLTQMAQSPKEVIPLLLLSIKGMNVYLFLSTQIAKSKPTPRLAGTASGYPTPTHWPRQRPSSVLELLFMLPWCATAWTSPVNLLVSSALVASVTWQSNSARPLVWMSPFSAQAFPRNRKLSLASVQTSL